MMQGGGGAGLKGPGTVEEGNGIPVEVGIEGVKGLLVVRAGSNRPPVRVPVPPGGAVTVPPSPDWPAGSILLIFTETAPVKAILVEVLPASE